MTDLVDTNVLVRYLTGDPPEQAARATRYLRRASSLHLVDLILAEVVYVLESVYEVSRADIAALARSIVASDRINVADELLVLRAVEIYDVDRLAFADAYLIACAERSGAGRVVSFDRRISKVGTVERVEP